MRVMMLCTAAIQDCMGAPSDHRPPAKRATLARGDQTLAMCSLEAVVAAGVGMPLAVATMAAAPLSAAACSRRVFPDRRPEHASRVSVVAWMSFLAGAVAVVEGAAAASGKGTWWALAPVVAAHAIAGVGTIVATWDGRALPCCSGMAVATAAVAHAALWVVVPAVCSRGSTGSPSPNVADPLSVPFVGLGHTPGQLAGFLGGLLACLAAAAACGLPGLLCAQCLGGAASAGPWLGVHEEGTPEMRVAAIRGTGARTAAPPATGGSPSPTNGRAAAAADAAANATAEAAADAADEATARSAVDGTAAWLGGAATLFVDGALPAEAVGRIYDGMGAWQDLEALYTDAAAAAVAEQFKGAHRLAVALRAPPGKAPADGRAMPRRLPASEPFRVVEAGCGTGRLALRVLGEVSAAAPAAGGGGSTAAPLTVEYLGLEVSETMADITRERLAKAVAGGSVQRGTPQSLRVVLQDASAPGWVGASVGRAADALVAPGSVDVFVVTYVLDAMPEARIRALLAQARMALRPHTGLLLVACLSFGATPFADALTAAWVAAYGISPALVCGCRPLEAEAFVNPASGFAVRGVHYVTQMGLTSQVLVATTEG